MKKPGARASGLFHCIPLCGIVLASNPAVLYGLAVKLLLIALGCLDLQLRLKIYFDQEVLFSATNILFDAELFSYPFSIYFPDVSSILHCFVDRELIDRSGELGISFYVLDRFRRHSISDLDLVE